MAKDTILKRKLIEAGISQAEVCRRVKRTPQHVNYVVNGVRKSASLSRRIIELCNGQIPLAPKASRRAVRRAM